MRLRILSLFVTVLVCALAAAGQTVVESESSLTLKPGVAEFTAVVEARAATGDVHFDLELLDTDGKIRAAASPVIRLRQGKQALKISIPIDDLVKNAGDDFAWYRLRYRLANTSGVISLSELLKDDFELRAAAFERVLPGQNLQVRIHTLHPLTKRAVKRVVVDGVLEFDLDGESKNAKLNLKASGETNGEGLLTLIFKIPADAKIDGSGNLKLTGKKGGLSREIDERLDSENLSASIFLTADKPLYQPGQSFNVRGLLFDPKNVAVSGAELEFSIEDGDGTVLYRQTVKTSAFGIAAISWAIPENAGLGTYSVKVKADGELRGESLEFKVSRYDLPNFAVTTTPNKPYYLPGDNEAAITVAGDYLFGKPVNNGLVRVVQESERVWNWKAQKYDTTEGTELRGETDATGKYIAKVDLTEENKKLQDSQWRRYTDLRFAAYYTDTSTNRTEQKRFDIRLTKEPIHIYLVRYSQQSYKLPLVAYLSTFYADGTPAVCNVEIRNKNEVVSRLKTNSLGAGKFEIEIPKAYADWRNYDIKIAARDKKGQLGTFDEDFYLNNDEDVLQMRRARTIYKPGEMVEVSLQSTEKNGVIYVDVVKDWTVIDSHVVSLRNGRADLSIPYRPDFKGDLIIAAYSDNNKGYREGGMRASVGVIYPEQQNLKLTAKFSAATYRPNDIAKLKFSVLDGSGNAAESALGVVVFDKAIEQRAKTDNEFGSYWSRFDGLMGYGRSFGRVTLKDINDLDLSKPIEPEMELAAEVMLAPNYYYPRIYHGGENDAEAKALYADYFKKQLKPVEDALRKQFVADHALASDEISLKAILSRNGINLSELNDPWGQNYVTAFSTEKTQAIMTLTSSGPDKRAGTSDDIVVLTLGLPYFTWIGQAIDQAATTYHSKTGKFIRDLPTLSAELKRAGIDLSSVKDRWGHNYLITFEVSGRQYLIRAESLGPNGIYEADRWRSDDFDVWKSYIDFFFTNDNEINQILSKEVNVGKKPFPKDEREFTSLLKRNGLDLATVRDGLGNPVTLWVHDVPRYSDKTVYENGKQVIKPVSEVVRIFSIRGRDTEYSVNSDVELASFSSVITERSAANNYSTGVVNSIAFSGAKGAIRGIVYDPMGAIISGSEVVATNEYDESKTYSATTNENGEFLLENLPSGKYRVSISARGFQAYRQSDVEVRSQQLIEIKATLSIGNVAATVDVSSDSQNVIDSTESKVQTTVTVSSVGRIASPDVLQNSTPRLREYFPETLVWQPELLTDKRGKAEMTFKMADNITTWKMYAIASTKNGKVGVAEKEVTAFQPFFVDLDPPKFLTEGDEIFLPTQVRNYTEKRQQVDVTMAKEDWFGFLGVDKQRVAVDAGNSANSIFGFKAVSPVKGGKQRVTAVAQTDSDAIEKPVTVRPNGQEIVHTDSRVFDGLAAFNVDFPANALPRTQRAELKIYPNLFAHVTESVQGMLERPYGCGEQTISSTYPNLMILKFVKPDSPLRPKAKKYLQTGYERLLGYQIADGGFTYWGGKDTSDVALTAYALRFLNDARSQITVDEEVVKRASDWLTKQQRADGSWTHKYYYENTEDAGRTKLITTYIARSLAMNKTADKNALAKALAYLKARNAEIDEPYAMALYGLAAMDAGDVAAGHETAEQLRKMAIAEDRAVYWKLETNTPFYGWGTAGRVETTALVLQLLIRDTIGSGEDSAAKDLISKATLFLLRSKDRYGVWYSTQTTINVLDAFLAALARQKTPGNQTIRVTANGQTIQELTIQADKIDPAIIDLTGKLTPTENRIEVRGADGSPIMSQIVASHYIDWKDADLTARTVNQSRALRLDYKCDKTSVKIMDEVTCSVEAERLGFKGYGMLLAEIGTPPGADVSRESLEKAIDSDWNISRYDILPDRIVVYMWARPGGTKFNFKFKPRYGINAQTPATIAYDYYNPEARATVAPLRFVVK